MGELLVAVGVGNVFINTFTVPVLIHPPTAVTVTTYGPAIFVVLLAIVGFCALEAKLLGPAHAKDVPVVVAAKLIVPPTITGELLLAITVITVIVAGVESFLLVAVA